VAEKDSIIAASLIIIWPPQPVIFWNSDLRLFNRNA